MRLDAWVVVVVVGLSEVGWLGGGRVAGSGKSEWYGSSWGFMSGQRALEVWVSV